MDSLPHSGPADRQAATPAANPAERRRHARAAVMWIASLRSAHGIFECLVIDISAGGAKLAIHGAPVLAAGEGLVLDLSPCGAFHAAAVWQRADYTGICFTDPPDAIAAAVSGVPRL